MKNKEILTAGKEVFREEAAELLRVSERLDEGFSKAVQLILGAKGKTVVCGIGKSAHIANKMVATFNSTGTKSQFLHAAEAIHGDLGLLDEKDVVICVSKSGNSQEIKDLAPLLKKTASVLIGITGNPDSALAKYADVVLDIAVTQEACPNNLAPTSSTTAQLVMGDALAVALMKMRNFTGEDFARFHPGGALGKRLLWTVGDVMDTYGRPFVSPDSNIYDVIDSLTSGKNGITVVLDEEKITGVITDGDLRRLFQKYKGQLDHLTAQEMLTPNPKTIFIEELAVDAFRKLRDFSVGQLLVIDHDDKYIGILDFHTLIKHGIEE